MTIKYRTQLWMWSPKIEAREITKETAACVFYMTDYFEKCVERREAKKGVNHIWTDTWQEGHAALMAEAERQVATLRGQLQRANGHAGNIKGMKPPKGRIDES